MRRVGLGASTRNDGAHVASALQDSGGSMSLLDLLSRLPPRTVAISVVGHTLLTVAERRAGALQFIKELVEPYAAVLQECLDAMALRCLRNITAAPTNS